MIIKQICPKDYKIKPSKINLLMLFYFPTLRFHFHANWMLLSSCTLKEKGLQLFKNCYNSLLNWRENATRRTASAAAVVHSARSHRRNSARGWTAARRWRRGRRAKPSAQGRFRRVVQGSNSSPRFAKSPSGECSGQREKETLKVITPRD